MNDLSYSEDSVMDEGETTAKVGSAGQDVPPTQPRRGPITPPSTPHAAPVSRLRELAQQKQQKGGGNDEGDDDVFYVPLQKVGRNYRSLRRRGAAVHSQLLKNAFEASSACYDSDGDDEDDYSMYASNSTVASRDGIPETNVPRKRVRHAEGEPSSTGGKTADAKLQSMLIDMNIRASASFSEKGDQTSMHIDAASVSSETTDAFPVVPSSIASLDMSEYSTSST